MYIYIYVVRIHGKIVISYGSISQLYTLTLSLMDVSQKILDIFKLAYKILGKVAYYLFSFLIKNTILI